MYTVTLTRQSDTHTATFATKADAEVLVNTVVGSYINAGTMTGGRLADWQNVTLFLGSMEDVVTVVTTYSR